MNSRMKLFICIWWLLQLCGLVVLGAPHLGTALIFLLLLSSLIGFVFGGRKVAFLTSFGLASYAGLTLLGALWFYQVHSGSICWLILAGIITVAFLNIIISFFIMKRLYDHLQKRDDWPPIIHLYWTKNGKGHASSRPNKNRPIGGYYFF